jgi:hypothetical protein
MSRASGALHHDVAAVHEQGARAPVAAEALEQFDGRQAGTGQQVGVDAPNGGDVRPRRRIGDQPVSGQLVGLLAVLTAALAVSLPGDGAVTTSFRADQAEDQRHVDGSSDGVGAVGVLFRTAPGEHESATAAAVRRGIRERARHAPQLRLGHSGDRRDSLRPPLADTAADRVQARGARLEIALVVQALGEDHVQEAEEEDQVCSRDELEMLACTVVGQLRGRAAPRVDDDQASALPHGTEVLNRGWHGVRHVAPEEQDDVAVGEVAERERQAAVEAQRPIRRRGGRGHAESAVVVDVLGAQYEPRELAELVGLLVRQAAATEHCHGICAVLVTDRPHPRSDVVERLLPRDGLEAARNPSLRRGEPVRDPQQLGARPALLAHAAQVRREVPRRHHH